MERNKRRTGSRLPFSTIRTSRSRPAVVTTSHTHTTGQRSSQPVPQQPQQPPTAYVPPQTSSQPPAPTVTNSEPSNPTITEQAPPPYGLHANYSSYKEEPAEDEKPKNPPPYETAFEPATAAYPPATAAYPPATAAYPPAGPYPTGAAPYPPTNPYPPAPATDWGTAAYPPYPPPV